MVEKKTVLITGCSAGGLGFALAKAFEDEGFHVFATARDPAKAASLAGSGIEILPLDVTSSESIDNCLGRVRQKTGGSLDVLVNNAGTALFGPLVHASIEEAKKVFDVHVFGMLAVAQAFVPLLVKARQGVMVNICSMAGAVPIAWQGIYNSSKAAETFLSETLRIELEPLGLRVVTAMVGQISTQLYDNAPNVSLPESSWYRSVEGVIKKQSRGEMHLNNEPVEKTARNLVQDTLGGRSGKIWRGGEAGTASVGSWLLPTRVLEWILHQGRGIYELKNRNQRLAISEDEVTAGSDS